jgi:hypothetical protein
MPYSVTFPNFFADSRLVLQPRFRFDQFEGVNSWLVFAQSDTRTAPKHNLNRA